MSTPNGAPILFTLHPKRLGLDWSTAILIKANSVIFEVTPPQAERLRPAGRTLEASFS